jgi:soluble lytic murein transglycosylase
VKAFYLSIVLLFFCPPLYANLQSDREQFLNVYQKIQAGSVKDYQALTKNLRHYILYPYLEHAYLKNHIDEAKATELIVFLKRFSNSVLADDIRDKWLSYLANQQQWPKILSYYMEKDASLNSHCLYNEALIRTGQIQRGLQQGKVLWNSKRVLPKACKRLSQTLHLAGKISSEDYWQRIASLMAHNQTTASSQLLVYLPTIDQQRFKHWRAVHSNPAQYLTRYYLTSKAQQDDSKHSRQIIIHALKRLLKKQPVEAYNLWGLLKQGYNFNAAEQGDFKSEYYYREARQHQPSALINLFNIPAQHRSKNASVWMARLALRLGDWTKLLNAIHSMDQETQADGAWVYWKARALQQLGKASQAKGLLQNNAKNITFYGLLSADRLGQHYPVLKQSKPDRSSQIARVKKLAGIQRALELFAIGKTALASKEWFRTLSTLDKAAKLAAAELALQQGQAFTAILSVSKTKDWNVVDLRFPLLYKQLVLDNAAQQRVDPAWVYGVIRRESAFKIDALSRVKAFGLMQLMPATAKEVAQKLGLKQLTLHDFAQAKTNIQLGSSYLAQMYKRFGNYVKATAAYNAGPGRIARWTADKPLSAEQWIESIPFDETRKYTASVMAYTAIYDHKLNANRAKKLSQRLLPILPTAPKTVLINNVKP